jgi:DNA polymerase type B, organellar and viral
MFKPIFGGRAVKSNHCNSLPRNVITVSTATEPELRDSAGCQFTETFKIGSASSFRLIDSKPIGLINTRLYHPSDFWELLQKKAKDRHTTWIIGYNILKDFRSLGMPDRFIKGEFTLDWPRTKRKKEDNDEDNPHCHGLAVLNSPPTIIACRLTNLQARVVFVDIANYFDCTISDLFMHNYNVSPHPPDRLADKPQWLTYTQSVSALLTDVFLKLVNFNEYNQLGLFRYTVASQSMSMFRHGLMVNPVYYHDNNDAIALERRAYIGGRTAVFRKGKINQTVYKLDVSSFYPSIMKQHKFPYTLNAVNFRDTYETPHIDHDLSCYIAEAKLNTRQPLYPVRSGKSILYPVGEFTTVLAGPELEQARSLGHLTGIRSWSRYKIDNLFSPFVDKCWALRRDAESSGNHLYADYAKRLANSLYGKFAELSPRWQIVECYGSCEPFTCWHELDMQTSEISTYRTFGYTVMKDIGRAEKSNTFPGISAFVTSYGRCRMNLLRGSCSPRECLYQGVDSLIVTQSGYDQLLSQCLISDRELGQLRVEGITDFGEIRGPADYTFGSKTVIAGCPNIDFLSERVEINMSRYLSREGLFTPTGYCELTSRQLEWHRKTGSSKGKFAADGYWEPFEAAELTNTEESAGNDSTVSKSALA